MRIESFLYFNYFYHIFIRWRVNRHIYIQYISATDVLLLDLFRVRAILVRHKRMTKDAAGTSKPRLIYSFEEARRVARGHGFSSKEEFLEYSCPGAYKLPKNPDVVWFKDWKGWDDFLGVPFSSFAEARDIARELLHVKSEEEYLRMFEQKKIADDSPASRLPYRPDLHFKVEWQGWANWLEVP
jgi:hypothetical protein